MWVLGDLKDQLGISHRKARKNHGRNLEAAPMFVSPHSRSPSELSTHHDVPTMNYEPAMLHSPSLSNVPRQTYLDTPPMTSNADLPPREPTVQYALASARAPSGSHLSPHALDARSSAAASPQPSYYSSSDIPPPSPLPSPKYKYSSGEITSTPPSRRTSVATSRVTSVSGRGGAHSPIPSVPQAPIPSTSPPPPPRTPEVLLTGPSQERLSAEYDSAYEMLDIPQSHPPSAYNGPPPGSPFGQQYGRSASEASHATYATAEEYWSADEYARGDSRLGHAHTLSDDTVHAYQPQSFVVSHPDDDDDRSTMRNQRRASEISGISVATSSWEGARAL